MMLVTHSGSSVRILHDARKLLTHSNIYLHSPCLYTELHSYYCVSQWSDMEKLYFIHWVLKGNWRVSQIWMKNTSTILTHLFLDQNLNKKNCVQVQIMLGFSRFYVWETKKQSVPVQIWSGIEFWTHTHMTFLLYLVCMWD